MNLDIDLNASLDDKEEGVNAQRLEPHQGMEFTSQEEAHEFYLKYAKDIGFGISIMHSRRSKVTQEFIDIKFACTRYGVKRESSSINQRPCLKIDCKAMLHIQWEVVCS